MEIPPKRRYRLGETMYVQEVLTRFYPGAIQISPVRLGTLPEPAVAERWLPEERTLLTVRMRWADAIAIEDGTLHLIEAKLLPGEYPEGLTKLELYRLLIPHTAQLAEYRWNTLVPELWTPLQDPLIARLAHEKGMINPIFEPPWFRDYLETVAARARRPPKSE